MIHSSNKIAHQSINNKGVSFLIPVLGYKAINTTIESIIEQGLACYEIIILRNGVTNLKHRKNFSCDTLKRLDYGIQQIKEIIISVPGKGNALNIGIELAAYELICVIDADCSILPGAVEKLFVHFQQSNVAAVGGRLIVSQSSGSWLLRLQLLEYMRVFHIMRPLYNILNANCILSGAFTMFRKTALLNIGCYDTYSVGEDMEIILRLQDNGKKRSNARIKYEICAVCETKTPRTIWRLMRQRDRWQRGLLDSLLKHWYMIGNPRYGVLGIVVMPYQLIIELLGPLLISVSVVSLCYSNNYTVLNITFMLYVLLEISITIYALHRDNNTKICSSLVKLPSLTLLILAYMLLQFPLMLARIYGMVTFKWRKTEW